MEWVTAGLVSFLWSWLAPLTGLARWLSDDGEGDDLKVHATPTPTVGGLGIALAMGWAILATGDWWFAIAAVSGLGLGLVDDRLDLAPLLRLIAEFGIGALVAVSVSDSAGLAGMALAVIATVVVINAVNLFDGLDGLAGGAVFVTALAMWAYTADVVMLSLAAAVLGFLVWNWHPARLFLGDGGAYFVAVVIVHGAMTRAGSFAESLALLGLAGVVLVDLVVTLLRRSAHHRPLFMGDRSHSYDQLIDRGWQGRSVAVLSGVLQVAVALSIISGLRVGTPFGLTVAIAVPLVLVAAAVQAGFVLPSQRSASAGE